MIAEYNKKLKEHFGRSLDGRPNFRLVWSTDQTEVRIGEFNEFSETGKIYLRTYRGAKKCQKYPFNKDRWVLEKLVYLRNPEVLTSNNGSYEPIYFFQDANGNPLQPIWEAIQYIMRTLLCGSPEKWSHSGEATENDEAAARDTRYFEEMLDERPEFGVLQELGEAVSFAGIKRKGE